MRDYHFFSIISDDVQEIAGKEHLPILVKFVEESHNSREKVVGFLSHKVDAEILAMKFHSTITEM